MDDVKQDIKEIREDLNRLITAIDSLKNDTAGIVLLYNNTQGFIKTGIAVQKFGLWLLKWPLIGAGLYSAFQWFMNHMPQ